MMKNNFQWYTYDTEKIVEEFKSNLKSGLSRDETLKSAE